MLVRHTVHCRGLTDWATSVNIEIKTNICVDRKSRDCIVDDCERRDLGRRQAADSAYLMKHKYEHTWREI